MSKSIEGVILAGGKGARLYPISEHIPEALVPLGAKTLVEYHLAQMQKVGIETVYIVIGHKGFEIAKLIGDGSSFGLTVEYVEQAAPLGIAHALATLAGKVGSPFFLFLGDIYFRTNGLQSMIDKFISQKANAILGTKIEHDFSAIKRNFSLVIGEGERVLQVIEKPKTIINHFKGCGIYLFDETIFEAVCRTPRTGMRDEYELTDSIQIMISQGGVVYHDPAIINDLNITYPEDLFALNMNLIDEEDSENIIGDRVTIAQGSRTIHSVLGNGVVIEENTEIENCLVFPRTRVRSGNHTKDAILWNSEVLRLRSEAV